MVESMEELLRKFQDPPKEYRAVPFWSWNDKLDPEFLKGQIREMEKVGLGGYFMHARGGLQTEYLSEEWMTCIKECIEEGKKLGMHTWAYDEEGWPSGFAGGIVTGMGEKYHMRWVEVEEKKVSEIVDDKDILGIYTISEPTKTLTHLSQDVLKEMAEEETVWIVRDCSNPYYIDILNKDVVKAFIECTYNEYYNRFSEEFGEGLKGFFTDEPQYSRDKIPWSHIFSSEFKQRYGYDIVEKLPALFIACEGYEKVRYDYWALVADLYIASFAKQIYDWCEEHQCKLTGHTIQEGSMFAQMICSAGVMPFYEYMQIPGIDWLGRSIDSPIVPKSVGSVASQLDKKFVLSETFALCGWDVSFEELKWIAQWQYVNGVNLMCQHLEGYTLRGLRKRDYPPSLFYQQPWWEEYKVFNDYFARLGVLLTAGKNAPDVLLIHPMKSGWITYDNTYNESLKQLDDDFEKVTQMLSDLHIEHHYGDETIISRHGSVDKDLFVVGKCKYKILVLPAMLTMDESTISLLMQFTQNGGKLISLGAFPFLCEGVSSEKLQMLKQKTVCLEADKKTVYQYMIDAQIPMISISQNNEEIEAIHFQCRDLGDTKIYYMVNHNQEKTYAANVRLNGKFTVKSIIVETGETKEIAYTIEGDNTVVDLTFLPMQSHILMVSQKECTSTVQEKQDNCVVKLQDKWDIEKMDLNALTLDYCAYRIDDGKWHEPIPVIKLMDILLNLKRSCDIAMKFDFEVDMKLAANENFYLVVETAEEFEMYVNGKQIVYQDIGWWRDSSFKKVDIRPYIQNGINEVMLKRHFYQKQKVYDVLFGENVLESEINKLTYDVELESIYVVGDFGVISKSTYTQGERKALFTEGGPFVITDKPCVAQKGDLTQQGFCFFAGAITLSQSLTIDKKKHEKVILDIGKPDAVVSKVFINDKAVKTLPWAPYEVDVTDFVKEGENKVSLKLFSGNRNLLGPHHHVDGELYQVGPSSFTDEPGWADTGKTEIWRDGYCFVRFGLKN